MASGVDNTSSNFADNPFLRQMGKKKSLSSISSRKRAYTTSAVPNAIPKSKPLKSKTKPTASSNIKQSTVKKTSPKLKKVNKESKVAAITKSLSNKGVTYGQSRPTKTKPFKFAISNIVEPKLSKRLSDDRSDNEEDNLPFERPKISKRRSRTKIKIEIDSEDTKRNVASDQIIAKLQKQIEELKKSQNEIKENMKEKSIEYERKLSLKDAKIEKLQKENAELKKKIDVTEKLVQQTEEKLMKKEEDLRKQSEEKMKADVIDKNDGTNSKNLINEKIETSNPLEGPSLDESLWGIEKETDNVKDIGSKSEVINTEPMDLRITTENELIAKIENNKDNDPNNEKEQVKEVGDNNSKEVKGIFDDLVDDEAEDTIFGDGDTPKTKSTEYVIVSTKNDEKIEEVEEDKTSSLPSLNVSDEPLSAAKSDDIDKDEDVMDMFEEKQQSKKKKKSGFFDDGLFGDEEEDEYDGRDIFASMVKKKDKIKPKKKEKEKDSLFDSDSNDDDLFAIEKEADDLAKKKDQNNDTINID